MTKDRLVTARQGVTLDEAKKILHENRIEKLLVVDGQQRLIGLITVKDIEKTTLFPDACRDERGRLRVGAAVGVGNDRDERAAALVQAGVDVICVDTAHGHSRNVLDAVRALKRAYPDLDVVAGNVGTGEGTRALSRRVRTR
jgi:IMP dehydrogenase